MKNESDPKIEDSPVNINQQSIDLKPLELEENNFSNRSGYSEESLESDENSVESQNESDFEDSSAKK